jgi:hypothetical protein
MRLTRMFWFGLALLIAGAGPLLAVIIFSRDPNPNPIGPGLLAFVTFWPAIILMKIGWARSFGR